MSAPGASPSRAQHPGRVDARSPNVIGCGKAVLHVLHDESERSPLSGTGMSGTGPPGQNSRRPRLEIRVLGPVEIAWDGRAVDIGGAKARALVARLLIDRGLVVSVDRLVDSLWGEHDARGSRLALRSTISRVRKRLQAAGATDELIVTRAPGYLLEVPAEVTDAARFERLVTEGRRELGRRRPSATIRLLSEAEQLWRGPAYSEVRDDPFARAEARRLEELRLSATETRMDAGLTLGRHGALAGELESLTTAHPLRERLWSQRMLALYRSGPTGRGVARLPGPARHPGGGARNRAGARRDLDGACHLERGARARLPRSPRAAGRGHGGHGVGDRAAGLPRPRAGAPPRHPLRRRETTSRLSCATGGRRSVPARAGCSWSKVTRASARPAWSQSWPAPSRRTGRWSCGVAATRIRSFPSSLSPRRSAITTSPSRPTRSAASRTGS